MVLGDLIKNYVANFVGKKLLPMVGTPLYRVRIGDSLTIKEEASKMADIAGKELMVYKNFILPVRDVIQATVVRELKNSIDKDIKERMPVIIPLEIPTYIKNIIVEEEWEPKEVVENSQNDLNVTFPYFTLDMQEKLTPPNDVHYSDRKEFYGSNLSYDKVKRIWDSMIADKNGIINIRKMLEFNLTKLTEENKNDMYVLYYILECLRNKTPDFVLGTPVDYINFIKTRITIVTGMIHRMYARLSVTDGLVIGGVGHSYEYSENKGLVVFVNGDLFRTKQMSGLEIDTLLDAMLSFDQSTLLPALQTNVLKQRESSDRYYLRKHVADIKKNINDTRYVNTKFTVRRVINDNYNDFINNTNIANTVGDITVKSMLTDDDLVTVLNEIDVALNKYDAVTIYDFKVVIDDVLGNIIFSKTNYMFMITHVDNYIKDGLNVMDSLSRTVSDMLILHISNQIIIE
jgi:hypothetical protein